MQDSPPTGRTKGALRALAVGPERAGPDRVVDEATAALSNVETAARFIAADGTSRVASAVVQAVREDDAETVRRGRKTIRTLQALRSALDDSDDTHTVSVDTRQSTSMGETAESPGAGDPPRESLSPRSRNGFTGRWQTRW